jgi:hypothetical protein
MSRKKGCPPPNAASRRLGQFTHGLLIALAFPGYLIWDLAKYCNSQERRLGKMGMFVVLSPIFGFSALVWFGLWALIVGLLWVAATIRCLGAALVFEELDACFVARDSAGQKLSPTPGGFNTMVTSRRRWGTLVIAASNFHSETVRLRREQRSCRIRFPHRQ